MRTKTALTFINLGCILVISTIFSPFLLIIAPKNIPLLIGTVVLIIIQLVGGIFLIEFKHRR